MKDQFLTSLNSKYYTLSPVSTNLSKSFVSIDKEKTHVSKKNEKASVSTIALADVAIASKDSVATTKSTIDESEKGKSNQSIKDEGLDKEKGFH